LPGEKGISVFEKPQKKKNEWVLKAGADIPDKLVIHDDGTKNGHWSVRPKEAMTLDEFKDHLKKLNDEAKKVKDDGKDDTTTDKRAGDEGTLDSLE
jgi:hypothetical protein